MLFKNFFMIVKMFIYNDKSNREFIKNILLRFKF